MTGFRFILLAGVAAFTLNACESMDMAKKSSDDPMVSKAENIDWDANAAKEQDRLTNIPGLQPVPNFPPPNDRDLMVMTSKLSGGSVEIYSMDGTAQPAGATRAPQPVLPVSNQGIPAASEPGVTIFPLEEGGPYPGQYGASLTPQTTWPVVPNATSGMPMRGGAADVPRDGVARVYFNHGSSRLDRDDRRVLANASEKAKFAPVNRISIEGHASRRAGTGDPVKDRVLNLKESMNRAFEVSKTMMLNGVPAEKIKTTAYGDTKPPAFVKGDAEAESRRVEVYTGSGF